MKTQLSRASRMEQLLAERFVPAVLHLSDESERHHGHAGAAPGGETHYALRMVAVAFEGHTRVERQRLVYQCLQGEFETGLHALSLDLKTPAEES